MPLIEAPDALQSSSELFVRLSIPFLANGLAFFGSRKCVLKSGIGYGMQPTLMFMVVADLDCFLGCFRILGSRSRSASVENTCMRCVSQVLIYRPMI